MKKIIFTTCVLCLVVFNSVKTQNNIVSVNHVAHFTVADLQQMGGILPLSISYAVDAYHVVYNTVDQYGNPTIASGALYVPIGCDSLPLLSYQHGTVLHRDAVPSRQAADMSTSNVGALIASIGMAVSAADFLGLGDSPGPHLYVHGETEATASIDMMRAGKSYVIDSLSGSFNDEVYKCKNLKLQMHGYQYYQY